MTPLLVGLGLLAILAAPLLAMAAVHVWYGSGVLFVGRPRGTRLRATLREAGALYVLAWWMLLARLLPKPGPAERKGRPVLLVHGMFGDPTNFHGLERTLRNSGRDTVSIWLGLVGRRLTGYGPRLLAAVRAMAQRAPDGFDVVCHSMGGVLLRRLLCDHPDLAPHVRTVVTLGSPHGGTAAIRLLPPFAELADLRPGSAWIAALPEAPSGWITVAGVEDAVVYPQATAHLPQSRRVDLDGIGHLSLLVRQDVHVAVLAALSG